MFNMKTILDISVADCFSQLDTTTLLRHSMTQSGQFATNICGATRLIALPQLELQEQEFYV